MTNARKTAALVALARATSVTGLAYVVALLLRPAAADVGAVHGSALLVWGYCQAESGARVTGGWFGEVVEAGSCHVGLFGMGSGSGDGSIFNQSTCEIPATNMFRENSDTCSCLHAPQCEKGETCAFDCGCVVKGAGQGAKLDEFFQANTNMTFRGTVHLDSGDVPIECFTILEVSNETALTGYELVVTSENPTTVCGSVASPLADFADWGCTIVPQYTGGATLETLAAEDGVELQFSQLVSFGPDSAVPLRGPHMLVAGVVAAAAVWLEAVRR